MEEYDKEVEVEDEVVDEEPEGTVIDIDGFTDFIASSLSGCFIVSVIVISIVAILLFSYGRLMTRLASIEEKVTYCYQEHKREKANKHDGENLLQMEKGRDRQDGNK